MKGGENMPREKENFREQLAVINEAFNGKPLLNASEVAKRLRMDRHRVAKRFTFKNGRISAVQLAKKRAEGIHSIIAHEGISAYPRHN